MTQGIYLDNNATTMVAPEVLEAMLPFFTEQFGNPSSLHQYGNKVGMALKQARQRVQTLLGAEHDSEIVFTSCGTESDSTAILSALRAQPDRKEIITTVVEHPAVLALCEHLEKEGYKVHYLQVDGKGRLDMRAYMDLLSDRVAIVSVMWANNESGTLFPVEEMAELARSAGVMFHTDAVQAVGKVPIDLKETAIDMLSLSGPQAPCPQRASGCSTCAATPDSGPCCGAATRSAGAVPAPRTAPPSSGWATACEMALRHMEDEKTFVKAMRDRLEQGILAAVPNCFVTGDPGNRLPNTCNIAFEYIEGEAILLLLNKQGIAASSGSACTSGSLEPSHVMRAMGIPFTAAHGTVRFSLSRYNTMDEIERVIEAVPPIVAQLRKLSPYWGENGPVEEPEKAFAPAYA